MAGFMMSNDLGVPTKTTDEFKNILVIFPHPDDESLTVGGVMSQFKGKNNLIVLTKGEKGASGPREEELKKSARIIGAENLIVADFKDGEVAGEKIRLEKYIDQKIGEIKPDVVITYDLAGLYGHEDHMVTAEVVTKLVKEKYPQIKLWYAALPEKVMKLLTLPTQMAKDSEFANKRVAPNLKVFVGGGVINKIQSVYAHKSQYNSFRSGVPKPLPLWFAYTLQIFEYFNEVN